MAASMYLSRVGSRIFDQKTRSYGLTLIRSGLINASKPNVPCTGVISRSMGGDAGKKMMKILPTNYEWKVFKDQLHFYLLLGIIPLGGVILYSNVVIGKAELTDIPEGYEPERWEYYRHPIQRFFARYVYSPPEKVYEINLHHLVEAREKIDYKQLERKVFDAMRERGDYKDWYYVDISERRQMKGKDYHDDVEENWSIPSKYK